VHRRRPTHGLVLSAALSAVLMASEALAEEELAEEELAEEELAEKELAWTARAVVAWMVAVGSMAMVWAAAVTAWVRQVEVTAVVP